MRNALGVALLFSAYVCAQSSVPDNTPQVPVSVTRYSESAEPDLQARVMNEATKLSFACRLFRGLYGRWPKDLPEIQAKTEGIDYAVFRGKALITPLPDDSERIQIFDGVNTREVKALPVNLGVTDAMKEAAKSPQYKIKL
jgi:hypothetical protein